MPCTHHWNGRLALVIAGFLLLGTSVPAQQANAPTATLRINGTETGFGPMSVVADPCSGFHLFLSSGPNPSMPFTLANGTLAVGITGFPNVGVFDLNFTLPNFGFVMDGIFGGAYGGNPLLNTLAQTDLGGQFSFSGSIGFGAPAGSIGAFQALVTDPTSPSGYLFTAATDLTIVSGAVGGTLAPPADSALTYTFGQGFTFPLYGTTYTSVNVADNGLLGFGLLATLQNLVAIQAGNTQPTTNSTFLLGTGGVAAPPLIGLFEHLNLAANGGQGSIIYSETPTQFNLTWCGVDVLPGGGQSSFTVSLYGASSASPGRIEITVTQANAATLGNGRVYGISPGGNGATSISPVLTGTNISAVSRNIQAGGVNAGFTASAANAAIYESFNFAWSADPINANFDFLNVTMRFDPAVPSSGTGPYTLRALSEASLAVTGVTPMSSTLAGGVPLTIKGAGFRNDGTTSATLGTLAVTPLTYVNSETLSGSVPPSPSAQTVSVNVSVGSLPASASLMNGFSYSTGPLNGALATLLDEEIETYIFTPSLLGTFNLYGTNWTQIHVHANGHAFFASSAPAPSNLNFISSPATWNGFPSVTVAPLFNDLCGDPVSCGLANASVTTVETSTDLTIQWNNWAQWPAINPGLTFSMKLDKTFAPASQVVFDYAMSVTPNINISQGGPTGIIVGMKPAGTSTAAPSDFQALSGGALGVPGAPLGVNANMFHWMRSAGSPVAVPPSQTANNWIFGSSTAPGPFGNTQVIFTSQDANNNNFTITLN